MKKKFSFTVIFFLAGIFLAGLISFKAFQEAYRSRKIQKEVEGLQAQAAQIQNENSELKQQIAYLQTPEFQEKVAKEKLNLQKPDENVIVVNPGVALAQQTQQQQIPQIAAGEELPNYQKWWNLFFKY